MLILLLLVYWQSLVSFAAICLSRRPLDLPVILLRGSPSKVGVTLHKFFELIRFQELVELLIGHSPDGLPGVVWWGHAPLFPTTKVTCAALVVAVAAQRGHLPIRPIFVRQSAGCFAPVAEPACLQPAVDAWAIEHFFGFFGGECEHFEISHGTCLAAS